MLTAGQDGTAVRAQQRERANCSCTPTPCCHVGHFSRLICSRAACFGGGYLLKVGKGTCTLAECASSLPSVGSDAARPGCTTVCWTQCTGAPGAAVLASVPYSADGLAQQVLSCLAKLKACKDCVLGLAATIVLLMLTSEDAHPTYLASVAAAVLMDQLLQVGWAQQHTPQPRMQLLPIAVNLLPMALRVTAVTTAQALRELPPAMHVRHALLEEQFACTCR